jgi:hypothetical protein
MAAAKTHSMLWLCCQLQAATRNDITEFSSDAARTEHFTKPTNIAKVLFLWDCFLVLMLIVGEALPFHRYCAEAVFKSAGEAPAHSGGMAPKRA